MDHISSQIVIPEFFDTDALRLPPYILYRVDGGDRYYYRPDIDRFFRSVTTKGSANLPTPFGIKEFMMREGQDSIRQRDERAAFGTFTHKLFAEVVINRRFDLDSIPDRVSDEIRGISPTLRADFDEWVSATRQDVLSIAAFMQERNVTPLAVEVCLCNEEDGTAGALDLVCRMDVQVDALDHDNPYKSGARKGQPREVKKTIRPVTILDYKSSRKGFYEAHELQLHLYKRMWDANFPDLPAEVVGNIAPTDWKTTPKLTFKDQTDSKQADLIPEILSLDEKRFPQEPSKRLVVSGLLDLDSDLSSCYTFKDAREIIMEPESDRVDEEDVEVGE